LAIAPAQLSHTTNLFVLNSLTQLQIGLAMGGQKSAGVVAR
jgi:hypothetical protein